MPARRLLEVVIAPDPIDASGNVASTARPAVAVDRPAAVERGAGDPEPRALIRAALASTPDAIVVIDHEGTVLELNRNAEQLFGYSREQATGQPLDQLIIPPRLRDRHCRGLAGAVASGAVPRLGRRVELPALRADGSSICAEITVRRLDLGGPPRFAAFIRDVSERKRAERQLLEHKARLRALASELALAEERERRRIARGLHDQVGHPLAFARQRLAELRESEPPAEMRRALDDVQEFLAQATEETRSLSFELGSPVLYELGLEAGLESLCRRLAESNGTRFEMSADRLTEPLAQDLQVLLYRVVEELLANVVKHARARAARVTVERVGDEVHVTVEDDGVGFAATAGSAPEPTGGLGLFSIRERLDHLGGRLEIEAGCRSGTRIVAVAPLDVEPSTAGAGP